MKYNCTQEQTILDALSQLSPGSSKTTLRSWLKEGRVTVDGQVSKSPTQLLQKGQQVALSQRQRFVKGNIRILFEDQHLVVIDKPSGLLSVAAAFEKGDTAHAILKDHYRPKRVFVVHRIDQDTSGVMLFALTESARDSLKDMFEAHDIRREYYAIVEGHPEEVSGTWQSYLYEDDRYVVHTTEDHAKGQLAITHFYEVGKNKRHTALVLQLETGRKNQIRVHCQAAGIPIVGDKKYGAQTNPIKRLCLHARLLEFTHPSTKQKLRFESSIPETFDRVCQRGT